MNKLQVVTDKICDIDIKKINDYYFIDTLGNIYSRPRKFAKGGLLKPKLNAYGYLTVSLKGNGIEETKSIHRLIAEAFIPNINNQPVINHIDGNKLNNCISNLEWCTYSHNNQHAWDTGLKKVISKSGERYIYIDKTTGRFRVMVPKNKDLGRYTELSDAIKVRDEYLSSQSPETIEFLFNVLNCEG